MLESSDELCTVPESVLFPYHPIIDITGNGIFSSGRESRSTITSPNVATLHNSNSSTGAGRRKRGRNTPVSSVNEIKNSVILNSEIV